MAQQYTPLRIKQGHPMKKVAQLLLFMLTMMAMPMGWYNMYHVLKSIGATDLMWFFFWSQIPLMIILQIISECIKE